MADEARRELATGFTSGQPPEGYLESSRGLFCDRCGCLVHERRWLRHDAWHAGLDGR